MTFPGLLKAEPLVSENRMVTERWLTMFQLLAQGTGAAIVTFHAARSSFPASQYPQGALLYETDRNAWYLNVQRRWLWVAGEMRGTIYSPDEKPTDLTGDDDGFSFYSTDFLHSFRWTWNSGLGTGAWVWDRSDASRRIVAFAADPGAGWKLCDGTAGVRYANSDGTTATLTLPDLTTGAYLKGGTWDGIVNAATTPTISGNTGSASPNTSAVSGGTPSGTISAIAATADPAINVAVGATGVAAQTHTHPAPTFTGDVLANHSHVVDAHTHSAGTLAASASEPKNLKVGWYFRL